jgi:kynurenine formamidase
VSAQSVGTWLFYTGWTKLIGKDNKRYGSVEPGLGVEGAKYLASLEVAMIGADTWGLEVIPFEKDAGIFEVHQILLPLNGIYILENMNTEEMVKDQAWEFLFTLGPSRQTGSSHSAFMDFTSDAKPPPHCALPASMRGT